MGFLDKIKSAASSITGGGAKVSIELIDGATRFEPFVVRVTAIVADRDLQVSRVYVKLHSTESVTARNVAHSSVVNGQTRTDYRDAKHSEETFQHEFNIAGAQSLAAKQTYTWEESIDLTSFDLLPPYYGVNARHEWSILGGLDAPGNDPDSGWVEIDME
jgi:hypothetical protein